MSEIKITNFHTHTTFCDGHNTAEEMILSAIEHHIDILGFSSHSMFPLADVWHIAPREHENYVNTIRTLAEKYKNQIIIKCGFEVEYIPSISVPEKTHFGNLNPDFLIGSVHYLFTKDGFMTVDDTTEAVQDGISKFYKNDGKKVVCDYFEMQRQMLKSGKFEIWGHPDLVRKRNGILKFFDENESWYKEQLKLTAEQASKTDVIAEINTGAIARGAMDDVYPSSYFLSLLHEKNVPVMINSDCHNAPDITCAFDRALLAAKKAGYTELTYPDNNELKHIKI